MSLRLKFWGVRGSIPVPGPRTLRAGGNTPCVEVRAGGRLIVLDCGSGLRELGLAWMGEFSDCGIEADVFVTHTHWDHIQGWPFFLPAYHPRNRFRIHSAHGVGAGFENVFKHQMGHNYFPVEIADMAARIEFSQMSKPLSLGGGRITHHFTNHPGVDLAYRLDFPGSSVVYLTDHECHRSLGNESDFFTGEDRKIAAFCRGADILVCDAQYGDEDYRSKRGWGHSRWRDTVDLAAASGVRRLALFHHDPGRSDDDLDRVESEAGALARSVAGPLEVCVAREGQEMSL
jgi:phosphoribosyl 1,2-cyclic phosphodiesterase